MQTQSIKMQRSNSQADRQVGIMAPKQTNITEAIALVAAEAARVAIQVMAAVNADNSSRLQNAVPKDR